MKRVHADRAGVKKGVAVFFILFLLLVIVSCISLYRRYKKAQFDYADHLADTVLQVNSEGIPLRRFGYYIYTVEDFVQKQALLYDPEDPIRYWNVHFAAGPDSVFMRDYARKIALEVCVRDMIYAQLARKEGYTLSAEDEQKAFEKANTVFDGMNPAQREATGLTREDVLSVEREKLLGEMYVTDFAASRDVTGYGDAPQNALSYDGTYYLQVVKPQHSVVLNEELIQRIDMGTITVNRKD